MTLAEFIALSYAVVAHANASRMDGAIPIFINDAMIETAWRRFDQERENWQRLGAYAPEPTVLSTTVEVRNALSAAGVYLPYV